MRAELSPILDDQPSPTDSLDFRSYVEALKDLIFHNKTQTPLTLGIFGRWGTGKTTLMRMLEHELGREGITTVWFNAWQYSDEDELWAAFLQSILNKIRYSLGSFRLPIFKAKLFFRRIQWENLPRLILEFLFRIIVAILPILIIDPISQQIRPEAKQYLDLGGNITALLLAIWIVIKPIIDSIRKNLSINFSNFQRSSSYQEHIAFLDEFREHFSDIVLCLPNKGNKRLAVFIDDLDRCSPERTIQVLDAIKLFVDVEGCVYILGVDVEVVQRAITYKYKDDLIAQREYLSKIIQLPFQLPPLTRAEMQEFLHQLTLDLPDSECQKVFITGLTVNPREIKRTINIFSLLWNLAAKRKELVGKINPIRLAKVVVIQHGYPELHKILQQRPYLLIELERFFREEEKQASPQALKSTVRAEDEKEADQIEQSVGLPADILEYSKNESLRSMLLLHEIPVQSKKEATDIYSFATLKPQDVAVYFTLTSRAESPKLEVSETQLPKPFLSEINIPVLKPGDNWGQYQIKYELEQKQIFTSYRAYDPKLDTDVVLILLDKVVFSPSKMNKYEQDALLKVIGLNHPNIIPVYESGIQNGQFYYVTQYLIGVSLMHRISKKAPLSNEEIMKIVLPLLDALKYIHENDVLHGDIRSSAVILDSTDTPFLKDVGLMSIIDLISEPGDVYGTPAYMSPEQARGEKIDSRADLYSFGVLLFECFTGRRPFISDTMFGMLMKQINDLPPSPKSINPRISLQLDRVITKLLTKDPRDRYQSAQDVKEALVQIR
jgi:hypothetical protein